MRRAPGSGSSGPPDWDAVYRRGSTPWEVSHAAPELMRVLDEGKVPPGRVLELGCGTGADALLLAKRGFEVTAVDSSPTAIERARNRVELEGGVARFVLDDVFKFAATAGQFDLIYDAGFYHFIRRTELDQLLDLLWRVTGPGSFYLTLAGNSNETAEGGPPRVSEEDIRNELGRLFDVVLLRPFRFEVAEHEGGYLGWSCLMQRPVIGQSIS